MREHEKVLEFKEAESLKKATMKIALNRRIETIDLNDNKSDSLKDEYDDGEEEKKFEDEDEELQEELLKIRMDKKETIDEDLLVEIHEWYTKFFLLLIRNTDSNKQADKSEIKQDYSLFPKIFNAWVGKFSESEEHQMIERVELKD